ncbi:hypothetical protein RCL1_004340 [Eukaryota sp. TZLM3-RCL]
MSNFLVRNLPSSFWKAIPKSELHCHLDGSVRTETVIDLANLYNVELPFNDVEQLRNYLTVPMDCPSLPEYLKGFDVTLSVLQTEYSLTRATFEIGEDAFNEGIRYLEIRFAPSLHMNQGLSMSSVVDAVCAGAIMAEQQYNISIRIIVCGMRFDPSEKTQSVAEIAWRYRNKGVVGFDLAGPENGFPATNHIEAYETIRSRGLSVTIHAAEAFGWQSARDAIVYCGAKRIGHGSRIGENPEMVSYVADTGIVLEVCLTSNVQTKAVTSLSAHPWLDYLRRGVAITLCTDNVLMSGVTLSSEFELMAQNYDVNLIELTSIIYTSFSATFNNNVKKKLLRQTIMVDYCDLLLEQVQKNVITQSNLIEVLNYIKGLEGGYEIFSSILSKNSIYKSKISSEVVINSLSNQLFNPALTCRKVSKDLIEKLPKADLHCRLIGSVPLPNLWHEIELLKQNFGSLEMTKLCAALEETALDDLSSIEILTKLLFPERRTQRSYEKAKSLCAALLTSPNQISRGVKGVIEKAIVDNIAYLELVIQPNFHVSKLLPTFHDVILTVNQAINDALIELSVKYNDIPVVNIVVASRIGSDSFETTKLLAEATVQAKSTVSRLVGFGCFGGELTAAQMSAGYQDVFTNIRKNLLRISLSTGVSDTSTILPALTQASSHRLSCCYNMHKKPSLLDYLALNKSIAVELTLSKTLSDYTKETKAFMDSVIRFYLESGVSVAICSINSILAKPYTEDLSHVGFSNVLEALADHADLRVEELFTIIVSGFRSSFMSALDKNKLIRRFIETFEQLLEQ